MRGIAKLATVLGGISIWACAKANDSKLIYDGEERGGRAGAGGSAARGGTNAGKGGSSGGSAGSGNSGGSAGSSGKSGGGSGGSSSATGGSSAGGRANDGGSTSTGGTAASSGDAGEGGIDPDVLARAKLVLHYQVKEPKARSMSVEMRLFLQNQSDDAMPLAPIEVRYWMTSEPGVPRLDSYYAAAATTSRVLRFEEHGDDSYVKVTFGSGTLSARTSDINSTEFQIKADADGDDFDQTDDYSFDPSFTVQPAPHDKITVYLQNRLVWGCEPSGACPSHGEGGAGGEGGESGAAGQSGASGASGEGGSSPGEGGKGGEPAVSGGQGGDGGDAGAAGAVSN